MSWNQYSPTYVLVMSYLYCSSWGGGKKKSLYNENLINDNGIWRTRYSNELYTIYDALDIVKVLKIERLRWLGHLVRRQELDPC